MASKNSITSPHVIQSRKAIMKDNSHVAYDWKYESQSATLVYAELKILKSNDLMMGEAAETEK